MTTTWRYIPHLQASGAIHMALDAWLFSQHCQGLHPPTLRFYTWQPAAISLGYHQHRYPDVWQQLDWQGQAIELVRRPSGGRAVLHQGDLTYAVVTSGLPNQRVLAYQTICEFLIRGWRSIGIELDYGRARRGDLHNPNCFETATGADLVLTQGTKLIGSAQMRQGSAVLQHGSMRLTPDAILVQRVFGAEAEFVLPQPRRSIQAIESALLTAASDCFQAHFVTQPLSPAEWQAVRAEVDRFKVDRTSQATPPVLL